MIFEKLREIGCFSSLYLGVAVVVALAPDTCKQFISRNIKVAGSGRVLQYTLM